MSVLNVCPGIFCYCMNLHVVFKKRTIDVAQLVCNWWFLTKYYQHGGFNCNTNVISFKLQAFSSPFNHEYIVQALFVPLLKDFFVTMIQIPSKSKYKNYLKCKTATILHTLSLNDGITKPFSFGMTLLWRLLRQR